MKSTSVSTYNNRLSCCSSPCPATAWLVLSLSTLIILGSTLSYMGHHQLLPSRVAILSKQGSIGSWTVGGIGLLGGSLYLSLHPSGRTPLSHRLNSEAMESLKCELEVRSEQILRGIQNTSKTTDFPTDASIEQREEIYEKLIKSPYKIENLIGNNEFNSISLFAQSCAVVLKEEAFKPPVLLKIHDNCSEQIDLKSEKKIVEDPCTEKALEVMNDKKLKNLYVPRSRWFQLQDNKKIQVQEMCELIVSDHFEILNLYRWACNQSTLQKHMHTLLSELLTFICHTNFKDVKFDNIPLTKEGKVALIDLDNNSPTNSIPHVALFKGMGRFIEGGFFEAVPKKWREEFIETTKTTLSEMNLLSTPDNNKAFNKEIKDMRERWLERDKKEASLKAHYESRGILYPRQPLPEFLLTQDSVCTINGKKYTITPAMEIFAQNLITYINNECLKNSQLLSLENGRQISLYRNGSYPFKESRIDNTQYNELTRSNSQTESNEKIILNIMKTHGFIYFYEINEDFFTISLCV